MAVMTVMGLILWIAAPAVMALLSPVEAIQALGAESLRIEAWAEPMFAASIVAYGVMVGVGDTMIPGRNELLEHMAREAPHRGPGSPR